jgi:hypothetical protein
MKWSSNKIDSEVFDYVRFKTERGSEMQTLEECLLMYRQRLRRLLYQHGVPSNPAVDDAWILDRVEELVDIDKSSRKDGGHSVSPSCDMCDRPAEWVRKTQFSGNHYFCDEDAHKESNFGQEDPSCFVWKKL